MSRCKYHGDLPYKVNGCPTCASEPPVRSSELVGRMVEIMKTAEQWYAEGGLNTDAAEINHRREIQADALRHAAKMARKHDGLSIMAAGWIEREAEQLEAASAPNDELKHRRE